MRVGELGMNSGCGAYDLGSPVLTSKPIFSAISDLPPPSTAPGVRAPMPIKKAGDVLFEFGAEQNTNFVEFGDDG